MPFIRKYKGKRKSKGIMTKSGPVSKKTVNTIKTVLNRYMKPQETKFAWQSEDFTPYNGTISSTSEYVQFFPDVARVKSTVPADGSARLGEQISPISCRLNLNFGLTALTRNMDILVTLYVLNCKAYKNYDSPYPNEALPATLLDASADNTTPFDGKINTSSLPVYRQNWSVIHKRTFRLKKDLGAQNGGTSGGTNSMTFKQFSLNIPTPKSLLYSGDSIHPSNFAPLIMVGYSHVDGSVPDVTNTDVTMAWNSSLYFKDA